MRKRFLAGIAAVCCFSMIIAGCGNSTASDKANDTTAETEASAESDASADSSMSDSSVYPVDLTKIESIAQNKYGGEMKVMYVSPNGISVPDTDYSFYEVDIYNEKYTEEYTKSSFDSYEDYMTKENAFANAKDLGTIKELGVEWHSYAADGSNGDTPSIVIYCINGNKLINIIEPGKGGAELSLDEVDSDVVKTLLSVFE